jgi:hypothetical protein
VLALLALLWFVYAAPADALTQVAPPGNSAVQQYLETVPSSGGNRPYRPGSGPGHHLLSRRAQQALNAAGPDGRAAAALAQATAPAGAAAPQRGHAGGAGGAASLAGANGSSAATAVGRRLLGSQSDGVGGMGIALPILLAVSLIVATLGGLRRRRSAA